MDLGITHDKWLDSDVRSRVCESRGQNHMAMLGMVKLESRNKGMDTVSLTQLMLVISIAEELRLSKVRVTDHVRSEVVVEVLIPLLLICEAAANQCSLPNR